MNETLTIDVIDIDLGEEFSITTPALDNYLVVFLCIPMYSIYCENCNHDFLEEGFQNS